MHFHDAGRPADAFDKSGIRSCHFKPKNSLVQIRVWRQRYPSSRGHVRFGDLSHPLKYFGYPNKLIKIFFIHDANQALIIKNRRPRRVYPVHRHPGFSRVFLRTNNRYRLQKTLPNLHQAIFSDTDRRPKRGIASTFKNVDFTAFSLSSGYWAISLARSRVSRIRFLFDVTRFTNPK